MPRDRESERRYVADVSYEMWRSGANPDLMDHDRTIQSYHDGQSAEHAAQSQIPPRRHSSEDLEEQCIPEACYEELAEELAEETPTDVSE